LLSINRLSSALRSGMAFVSAAELITPARDRPALVLGLSLT
jgi:hypothetical protein